MYRIVDLFDLEHTMAADYLRGFEYPWEALKGIKDLIISLQHNLDRNEYDEVSEQVFVHKSATVAPTAYLGKPCIIGPNTEVRHCAFVRGSALVGANCVVGNSVELKNCLIMCRHLIITMLVILSWVISHIWVQVLLHLI